MALPPPADLPVNIPTLIVYSQHMKICTISCVQLAYYCYETQNQLPKVETLVH